MALSAYSLYRDNFLSAYSVYADNFLTAYSANADNKLFAYTLYTDKIIGLIFLSAYCAILKRYGLNKPNCQLQLFESDSPKSTHNKC